MNLVFHSCSKSNTVHTESNLMHKQITEGAQVNLFTQLFKQLTICPSLAKIHECVYTCRLNIIKYF